MGDEIRHLVLHRPDDFLTDRAEALLFAADKAEHVETVVRPALERGKIVLTDRFVDSTLAYQGAGRQLGPEELRLVSDWATGGLRPHLTVLLDLEPEDGLARADAARTEESARPGSAGSAAGTGTSGTATEGTDGETDGATAATAGTTAPAGENGRPAEADRVEREPNAFHRAVRREFLELAAADQHRYAVVDAEQDPEEVAERIRARVEPLLSRVRPKGGER